MSSSCLRLILDGKIIEKLRQGIPFKAFGFGIKLSKKSSCVCVQKTRSSRGTGGTGNRIIIDGVSEDTIDIVLEGIQIPP